MQKGWTLERRQRKAEPIQLWQPWKLSTGARTKEGKEISRMSALRHGGHTAAPRDTLDQVKEFLNR